MHDGIQLAVGIDAEARDVLRRVAELASYGLTTSVAVASPVAGSIDSPSDQIRPKMKSPKKYRPKYPPPRAAAAINEPSGDRPADRVRVFVDRLGQRLRKRRKVTMLSCAPSRFRQP